MLDTNLFVEMWHKVRDEGKRAEVQALMVTLHKDERTKHLSLNTRYDIACKAVAGEFGLDHDYVIGPDGRLVEVENGQTV